MSKFQTIVLAWAEKTKLVPTGRHVMQDMNWFPEFRAEWEGRAAIWINKGTEADLRKAQDYAKTDQRHVFIFPISERDPLGKAREMVCKEATAHDRHAI